MSQLRKVIHNGVFLGLLTSVLTISGCKTGGSSGGGGTATVTPWWQSCSACATNIGTAYPGLIGVHSATVDGSVLFSLDMIVDQARSGLNWNDPKAILYYSGPVSLQGVMRVSTSNNFNVCNAPAGDYTIQPMTTSTLASGGSLSYGTFQAVSSTGGRVIFRIGSSSLYNYEDPNGVSSTSYTNRLQLNINIDSVNNVPCGALATQ